MLSSTESPYFLKFSAELNTSVKMFFFHYAGGSASIYRNWVKDLPSSAEVIGIQLPGREGRFREAPYKEISLILGDLLAAMESLTDSKPYIFFGHSLGGLIAYELARELNNNKTLPQHLVISGCQAPHLPLRRKKIHHLPDRDLLSELALYRGIPEAIINNRELMSTFIPVIRADFTISENYSYKTKKLLSCPITLLNGLEDPYIFLEDIQGWKQHTSGEFNQYLFQGDHFFIFKDAYPQVISLLTNIVRSISS